MRFVPLFKSARPAGDGLERLSATGSRFAEERLPAGAGLDLVECRAIWCKYVEGKLRFTIGAASIDLPFSGWTRTLSAPPFVCPHTGAATFRLAPPATGGLPRRTGRGLAETGRRLLSTELSVRGDRPPRQPGTGRSLPDQRPPDVADASWSPVRLLWTAGEPAGRGAEACPACRRMKAVTKADPRMARVLHEHPRWTAGGGGGSAKRPGYTCWWPPAGEAADGGRGQGNPRTPPMATVSRLSTLGRVRTGAVRLCAAGSASVRPLKPDGASEELVFAV